MSSRAATTTWSTNQLDRGTTWLLLVPILVIAAALSGCRRKDQRPLPGTDDRSTPETLAGLGFSTPVSVAFDPDYDRYYVANLGFDASGGRHAFISIVLPSGDTLVSKFIDGDAKDIVLRQPDGMVAVLGHLFVADGNVVRRFDRRSGAADGEVTIPGARALGDLDADGDGALYVTDRGDSSSTGAVYRLFPDGKLDTLARGAEAGHPTGIAVTGDSVWVATREGEVFRLSAGKRLDVMKVGAAGLDGLVVFAGEAFTTTEDGHALVRGKPGGPFTPIVSGLDRAGNLAHDVWRNRLLVPLSGANAVRVVRLAF